MQKNVVLYGCSKNGEVEYDYLVKKIPDAQFVFCQTEKSLEKFGSLRVISLGELYSMDRESTEIYVYDDSETLYEKKERLELAGFKNIYPCIPGLEVIYDIIWRVPDMKEELAELFEEIYICIL